MKRFLFSTLFFSLMVVGVQAQSTSCCSKSKTASSKSCESKNTSTTAEVSTVEAAAKLASMDESIETKTCPVSGKVSYTKKETSAKGEVSYVDVNYDAETNTFVNASPMKMDQSKKECSGKDAKACCSSKSASASAKGCCSGKSAAKTTSTSVSGDKTKEEAKPTKG